MKMKISINKSVDGPKVTLVPSPIQMPKAKSKYNYRPFSPVQLEESQLLHSFPMVGLSPFFLGSTIKTVASMTSKHKHLHRTVRRRETAKVFRRVKQQKLKAKKRPRKSKASSNVTSKAVARTNIRVSPVQSSKQRRFFEI